MDQLQVRTWESWEDKAGNSLLPFYEVKRRRGVGRRILYVLFSKYLDRLVARC